MDRKKKVVQLVNSETTAKLKQPTAYGSSCSVLLPLMRE